jgi:hypothetical protein
VVKLVCPFKTAHDGVIKADG